MFYSRSREQLSPALSAAKLYHSNYFLRYHRSTCSESQESKECFNSLEIYVATVTELFSTEYHKTKAKVITLVNHNGADNL